MGFLGGPSLGCLIFPGGETARSGFGVCVFFHAHPKWIFDALSNFFSPGAFLLKRKGPEPMAYSLEGLRDFPFLLPLYPS